MGRKSRMPWLLASIAIVVCAVVFFLVPKATRPPDGTLTGKSEGVVRAVFGPPKREFAGHYGMPDYDWAQQFKGEIKSAVYDRLIWDLYVSYEYREGNWCVISNSSIPRDGEF